MRNSVAYNVGLSTTDFTHTPNFFKNNIIYSTVLKTIETDTNEVSFDYNIYFNSSTGGALEFIWSNPTTQFWLQSTSPGDQRGYENVGSMGSRDFVGTAIRKAGRAISGRWNTEIDFVIVFVIVQCVTLFENPCHGIIDLPRSYIDGRR